MKIFEKTWESEITGLKFGEIILNSNDLEQKNLISSNILIKDFDFVVARIRLESSLDMFNSFDPHHIRDEKINYALKILSDLGFKFQDIQVFFSVYMSSEIYSKPLEKSKWPDIIFKQELSKEEINFLFEFLPSRFKFSWYFKEIPNIAEKIYRKWLEEIILSDAGIYVFAAHKNDSSRFGFLGAKNVSSSARFPLMFSQGIPSYVIIKEFMQILRKNGFKNFEIKISLISNKKFALLYKNSITKCNPYIEIIMSKKNF